MNSRPMILRLRSGSVTPRSFARKRFAASTNTTLRCSRSAKRRRTCAPSSLRSRPLSTNTQVRRSPMARWTSRAATEESTPPDRAQMTRPFSPTWPRIFSTASSMKEAAFQSRRQPHTSRKLESTRLPSWVWTTSGWNRRPNRRRSRASIAATALLSELATTLNPGGGFSIESPWLIHTRDGGRETAGAGARLPAEAARDRTRADRPASAPPRAGGHELHPVAHAQHGHAQLEDRRLAARRSLLVDAVGPAGEDDALGMACREGLRLRVSGEGSRNRPAAPGGGGR